MDHLEAGRQSRLAQKNSALSDLLLQVLYEPCNSFMHAGGVLADALVPNQTAASMRAVFSPKVYPNTFMPVPLHYNHVTGPCMLYSCAMMGFQGPQVAQGSAHY